MVYAVQMYSCQAGPTNVNMCLPWHGLCLMLAELRKGKRIMSKQDTRVESKEAYVEALIERVMNHYMESRQCPGLESGEFTPKMVLRLCRAVATEGYGE
jgi:hypothetical protein